jgi:hypothetical protein
MSRFLWTASVVIASCAPAVDEIKVTEKNDLGVVAIQTSRFDDGDVSVFELRGVSSTGESVALVQARVGNLPELATLAPMPGLDTTGTEIAIEVNGELQPPTYTREVELIHMRPAPATQGFLTLPEVSSTLMAEARIAVDSPSPASAGETPYYTYTQPAPSGYLISGSTAYQACYDGEFTMHVNGSAQVAQRYQNPYYSGCKAINGTGSCSGSSCYFGPLGFAVVSLTGPYSQPLVTTPDYEEYDTGNPCENRSNQGLGQVFPTGYGYPGSGAKCCDNGSGSCDGGGRACSTCGGSQPQANAIWDYK